MMLVVAGDFMLDVVGRCRDLEFGFDHIGGSDPVVAAIAGGAGTAARFLAERIDDDIVACGYVGEDAPGALVVSSLQEVGVDCSGLSKARCETPIRGYLLDQTGLRMRLKLDPSSYPEHSLDTLEARASGNNDLLLVDFAKTRWPSTVGDVLDRYRKRVVVTKRRDIASFAGTDVVVVNALEREANGDIGGIAASLRRKLATPAAIVVTGGDRGAAVSFDGGLYVSEPTPVSQVVNDAGAGDVLGAAFLQAFTAGGSIPEALDFAVGAASESVMYWLTGLR